MFGIKNINVLQSNARYLNRGLPTRVRGIQNLARAYPAENLAITALKTEIESNLRTFQALVTGSSPDYQKVFSNFEACKSVAHSLLNSVLALHESMIVSGDRNAGRMDNMVRAFRSMIGRLFKLSIEPDSETSFETDNGIQIGITGNLCVHQLCFKNVDISILDTECVAGSCDQNKNNNDNEVIIKLRNRKTTQLTPSSGIRLQEGSSTEIRITKSAGNNGEGDLTMKIPALVTFLGNTYTTVINVNKTSSVFHLSNVFLTSDRYLFDVTASALFNPATSWSSIRFRYKALSSGSTLKDDMMNMANTMITNVTLKMKARRWRAQASIEESKQDLARLEFELTPLRSAANLNSLEFRKAESDFLRNKTKYETAKKEYRGYFSLGFLNQVGLHFQTPLEYSMHKQSEYRIVSNSIFTYLSPPQ